MMKKRWITSLCVLALMLGALNVVAQETATAPTAEEQQKEKAEREKRAFVLLEQLVDEAQLLRLPDNRVRMQIGAGEMLWQSNEGRARSLFAQAGEGVAEIFRIASTDSGLNERRNVNQIRTPIQLRQELIMTVARYDAPLAYQLLAATRPPTELVNNGGNFEDDLEQRLLAQVAALDPKVALQN